MLGCRISEPGCEENHFVVTVGEDNDVRVHNIKEGPRNIRETKPHEIETQMWYCKTIVQLLYKVFQDVSGVLSFASLISLRVAFRFEDVLSFKAVS